MSGPAEEILARAGPHLERLAELMHVQKKEEGEAGGVKQEAKEERVKEEKD